MDTIHIKGLEIFAKHGVRVQERTLGQKFVVSLDLFLDTRRAGLSDDLTGTVDYGAVCRTVTDFLTAHTFSLIEAAAERLAQRLLLNYPSLCGVHVTLEKPWAPVGLPLKTVAVEIERFWHTAYLALGSNLGDRKAFLDAAVAGLDAISGCTVIRTSDWIETEPYGVTDQGRFLNGALELRTLLWPKELLEQLHALEGEAHRERTIRWGPRTLDLDILFYDDRIVDTAQLQIPHPDLQNRSFVLEPMNQIAPWVRHPVLNRTIAQLRGEIDG